MPKFDLFDIITPKSNIYMDYKSNDKKVLGFKKGKSYIVTHPARHPEDYQGVAVTSEVSVSHWLAELTPQFRKIGSMDKIFEKPEVRKKWMVDNGYLDKSVEEPK